MREHSIVRASVCRSLVRELPNWIFETTEFSFRKYSHHVRSSIERSVRHFSNISNRVNLYDGETVAVLASKLVSDHLLNDASVLRGEAQGLGQRTPRDASSRRISGYRTSRST